MSERRFSRVAIGDELPGLVTTPTNVSVFLFGVALWSSHRIHYDAQWARSEGFADVVVPGQLLAAYAVRAVAGWAGGDHRIRKVHVRYEQPIVVDQQVTTMGRVIEIQQAAADDALVTVEVEARTLEGVAVLSGRVVVSLPA